MSGPVIVKRCRKCEFSWPTSDFYRTAANPDGLSYWCRDCDKERKRAYHNRPGIRERGAAKALERYHSQPKEDRNKNHRAIQLMKRYGLTEAAYEALLTSQGGVCAICKQPPKVRKLAVDHDHACCPGEQSCGNCIRGLLCIPCNTFLGRYEALGDAAELYLRGNK